MECLGRNIRRLRRAADMTQAELGKRVGDTDSQTVCKWEKGTITPSLKNAAALASALNCTVDELLKEEKQ